MASIFAIGYGSAEREERIRKYLDEDHIVAIILAATHFEWMIKRAIIKMSKNPTKRLREVLEKTYVLDGRGVNNSLQMLWNQEIAAKYKNAALAKVVPNLTFIKDRVKKIRGFVVHGNGLASKKDAALAVDQYLAASKNIREFAAQHEQNLDKRLSPRRVSR
jgi:hypothetical protein